MRPRLDLSTKGIGLIAALGAGLCTLIAAGVIFASMTGQPARLFAVEAPAAPELPAGSDIAGWASVDRDSIAIGETVNLTLRVRYRESAVDPDLETFRKSASYGRFNSIAVQDGKRSVAPGIVEYSIEHRLQGVNVLPHQSYKLDPGVLFYKSANAEKGELGKLRIPVPTIYVSAYYPESVAGLALRPLRENIHDPLRLRQSILIACGLVLALLSIGFGWRLGRRRRDADLSEAERLWLEFRALDSSSLDARAYLSYCENVFTRLRQSYTNLGAEAFWIEGDPEDVFWKDVSQNARAILRKNYRSGPVAAEDTDAMTALLKETFSALVAEERLTREQEPSFLRRIRMQPGCLTLAGIGAGLALALLVLSAVPAAWLSPTVKRYNAATDLAKTEPTRPQGADELFDLSQQPGVPDLKAAALYNSGTALAELDPLREQLFTDPTAIVDLFKDAASLEPVVKSQALLAAAEDKLKGATISDPRGEDIRRNLELVVKKHRIVATALVELLKMQEESFNIGDDRRTLLDALNMVLHEDVRDNEKAGKQDYYIGEKF